MEPALHLINETTVDAGKVFPNSAPMAWRSILPVASSFKLPEAAQSRTKIPSEVSDNATYRELHDILQNQRLSAVFQPIIRLDTGEVSAYEGLIRGPADHPLRSPYHLFSAARKYGLGCELEKLCRQVILSTYADLELPGKIFINISPEHLVESHSELEARLEYLDTIGIGPERIVLELTENQATYDYGLMRNIVECRRQLGFQIAIDDLGEGFSSLRLWSEIRPDYVKIDMHFIQGMDRDPVKLQFVQSIQSIARKSGTVTIAEGIETEEQLHLLQKAGIACGQGYHIERPNPKPTGRVSSELVFRLQNKAASQQTDDTRSPNSPCAWNLLKTVPVVTSSTRANEVYEIFADNPQAQIIAVVEQGIPIGTISRFTTIDRFAKPFQRELFGKRSCVLLMNPKPLVFDKNTSLQDISLAIVDSDPHHLSNGFAITDRGLYIGMGTGHDVMREITQMQINAARYANPLTQLPGNVPINEEIDRLLLGGREFVACYCDIDHFKPFNDSYGYRRGDDVIQLTARILTGQCEAGIDFVGHIGGDDFILLYQSDDWERRCRSILEQFESATWNCYNEVDRKRGGYFSEDRQGNKRLHPLLSLSLGIVKVDAGRLSSNYQIASAASEAKKQAKAIPGNSIFIERRAIS